MPLWQTKSKNNEKQDIFKEYIHVTKTLYLLTLIITNTNRFNSYLFPYHILLSSLRLSESDSPPYIKLGNQYSYSTGFCSSSHAIPSCNILFMALLNRSGSAYCGILAAIDECVTLPPHSSANFITPKWSAFNSTATLQITLLLPVSMILKSLPSF